MPRMMRVQYHVSVIVVVVLLQVSVIDDGRCLMQQVKCTLAQERTTNRLITYKIRPQQEFELHHSRPLESNTECNGKSTSPAPTPNQTQWLRFKDWLSGSSCGVNDTGAQPCTHTHTQPVIIYCTSNFGEVKYQEFVEDHHRSFDHEEVICRSGSNRH